MADKFKIEKCFIGVIIPEEHAEYVRNEWGKETGDFNICLIASSNNQDTEEITHWICVHQGTTLDFAKIEIFFRKKNIVLEADEDFSYFLKWPDSKGYIIRTDSQFSVIGHSFRKLNLFHIGNKYRKQAKSYNAMIEMFRKV